MGLFKKIEFKGSYSAVLWQYIPVRDKKHVYFSKPDLGLKQSVVQLEF